MFQKISSTVHNIKNEGFFKTLNASNLDQTAIDNYNSAIASGASHQDAFAEATKNTTKSTKQLLEAANGAVVGPETIDKAMKQTTLTARAGQAAFKGFSLALNMVAGVAIGFAINAVITGIDNFIHRVEKAKQAAKEAQDAINESQGRLKEASSTIAENRDRFLELSEGVDEFSNNLTLSQKDYEEYLSISQELAELFPKLIADYDNQGNALLRIGKNADETTEKLNELLETEQLLADQTLIDNMDDVAKGIAASVGENNDDIVSMKSELKELKNNHHMVNFDFQNPEGVFQFKPDDFAKYSTEVQNALDAVGAEYKFNGYTLEIISATEQQLTDAQKHYDAFMETENRAYEASVAGLKKNIEEKKRINHGYYAQMTANLQVWTKQNYDYQYISAPMQKLVDAVVPSIDWSSLEEPPQIAAHYEDYIQKNILNPLMEIPEEYREQAGSLISELMSFEEGDLDILTVAYKLQTLFKSLEITLDLTPIIGNEQNAKQKLVNSLDSILLSDAGESRLAVDSAHERGNEVKYIDSRFYEYDPADYKKLGDYTKIYLPTADEVQQMPLQIDIQEPKLENRIILFTASVFNLQFFQNNP